MTDGEIESVDIPEPTVPNYTEWLERFIQIYKPEGEIEYVENAKRLLYQHKPSEEVLKEIYERQLTRNKWRDLQRRKGKKVSSDPKNLWFFFNSSKWMDPIPSFSEDTGETLEINCACGEKAKVYKPYPMCTRCASKEFAKNNSGSTLYLLRETWKQLGIKSTREACMKYLRDNRLTTLLSADLKRQVDAEALEERRALQEDQ